MQMRICPYCHMPNHSADTISDWKCLRCGATIVREYNQPSPNYAEPSPAIIDAKLVDRSRWEKLTALMAELIVSLIGKCHDGCCRDDCVNCLLFDAKTKAYEIAKMMEGER